MHFAFSVRKKEEPYFDTLFLLVIGEWCYRPGVPKALPTNGGREMSKKLVVVAVGGNDLIRDTKKASLADQQETTTETARRIAEIAQEFDVVVTHGNGPQVGFILLRSAKCGDLHPVDVDIATADTQAGIGTHFKRGFARAFAEMGITRKVAVVITEVEVDPNDPSMLKPTKPIGPFYSDSATLELQGVPFKEDSGRGYRRVIASPPPLRIREMDEIRTLRAAGHLVDAVGGGGIPVVVREGGIIEGVAAVIDKDRASGLLAKDVGEDGKPADHLAIGTAVTHACLNFGKPNQQAITTMTVAEARKYMAEGHFAPGAMLPKIEAMADFVEATGNVALMSTTDRLLGMLRGDWKLGTSIWPDERGGVGG